jgi:hypothetical protein
VPHLVVQACIAAWPGLGGFGRDHVSARLQEHCA